MYAAGQRYTQPQTTRPRPEKKRSYRLAEKAKAKAATKHVHFGGATVVGYSAETKEKAKEPTTTRPTTSRQSSYSGRPTTTRQASYSRRPTSSRQSSYSGQAPKRHTYKSQSGRPEEYEVVVKR
ncbi:hypothetical protein LTS10_012244 [Elasticomyces elasticus]|nr:hypothetical protein LTS10_012244 [Elasticomyces elasticus]